MAEAQRVDRREFLFGMAGLPTGLAVAADQQDKSSATGSSQQKFVGIQMGPHSMLDEGIDRVLDLLQEQAGINSVVVDRKSVV